MAKYQTNPMHYICTNKACPAGVPSWRATGQSSNHKCYRCGKSLRRCKSEPRK